MPGFESLYQKMIAEEEVQGLGQKPYPAIAMRAPATVLAHEPASPILLQN